MKKSAILFLLLFCLSVAALGGLAVWVNQGAESVEVTEETLLGDPGAAAGLEATVRRQMRLQLGWETTFSPQNPQQAQTNFSFFSMVPDIWESNRARGAYISIASKAITGSMTTTSGDDVGLKYEESIWGSFAVRPVIEMAKTMQPEEVKTQTLCLSDYYDAVPLCMEFHGRWDPGDSESQKYFENFFYIPMPEGINVTYTLTKGASGGVVNVEMTSQQALSVSSHSARGEHGWFLVLDGFVQMGPDAPAQPLDFSQIQGGYGLYYIPSKTSKEMEVWDGDFALTEIETAFPIPEGERGMDVHIDQQNRVLLFTAAGDTWYLTVLDPEGQKQLQRLEIGTQGAENAVRELTAGEDGLAVVFQDGQICLLSEQKGMYGVRFSCAVPEQAALRDSAPISLVWDEDRLALLGMEENAPSQYLLMVWQKGSCTFLGRYATSLERDNVLTNDSLEEIQTTEQDPVSLKLTA